MLDFSSSLYLGFDHPSTELAAWSSFTEGVPWALHAPPEAAHLGLELARLQHLPAGCLFPSTLHAFSDVFQQIAKYPTLFAVDEQAYPVMRWVLECVRQPRTGVRFFRHCDPQSLERCVAINRLAEQRVAVVTDGLFPFTGRFAPLPEYIEIARRHAGLLVIDDSQAIGLCGPDGGGSLRAFGLGPKAADCCLAVSSLAKSFGAPAACVAGDADWIAHLHANGRTRVHSSPPSTPVLRAVANALSMNQKIGDARRRKLATLVAFFRTAMSAQGAGMRSASLFPVQPLDVPHPARTFEQLRRYGVEAVLLRSPIDGSPRLVFVLTGGHTRADICQAAAALHSASRNELPFSGLLECARRNELRTIGR